MPRTMTFSLTDGASIITVLLWMSVHGIRSSIRYSLKCEKKPASAASAKTFSAASFEARAAASAFAL